mmetsp:Transcript_33515/g.77267  ORF Transcript_33515/g.77267 Transcript_33515/m.77267 type:complete len:526 (+) Transcript_33515:569-2146(+)
MKHDIHQVVAGSSHLFVTEGPVLASPGESTNDGFLDLKQVVDSLCGVNKKIGSSTFWSKGPDLPSFTNVPTVFIGEETSLRLGLSTRSDIAIINGLTEFRSQRLSLHKETVVLVGRLGKTCLAGLGCASLAERNDRIRDLYLCTHKVILEILEANLKVELSRCSNNMFTGFFGVTQNHGIGLCKTLHSLDKLWKIGRVLWLNSATHNRGHRELHCLNAVGIFLGCDCSGLQQVLINTHKGTSVSGRNIGNLLRVTTHHDNSTLDILDPQLRLLASDVVGSHDTDLLTGGDLSTKDTTKGVETSLIGSGHHLRNVHTERSTLGSVASTDGNSRLIIERTIIESVDTVLLGNRRRGKMEYNHLKNSVTSGKPFLHNTLQQLLSNKFLLVSLQFDANGIQHLLDLSVLLRHDSSEQSGNRSHDELTESTLKTAFAGCGPNLSGGIKVPVTPELSHHLFLWNSKLGTICSGETLQSEGPLVETRSKRHRSFTWVNLHISEGFVVVCRHNDVDRLNGTTKGLVELFCRKL